MPNYSLNYTPLTNPVVWFPTKDSFNSFIGEITVTIPNAGASTPGLVTKSTISSYVPATVTPDYIVIANDEGSARCADATAYDNLKTKVDLMGTKLQELITALQTSGILNIT